MEVIFRQQVEQHRALHYWYGGQVAIIKHKGFTFGIDAIGDVIGRLYDERNIEIAYIKDRQNGGHFYSEMHNYIKDDTMLLDLLERNKLVLDYNNWWECFVIDDKGHFHDLSWTLDCMNIFDAIEEVKVSIEEVIKNIKGE